MADLTPLAEEFGTPLFVCDARLLRMRIAELSAAFSAYGEFRPYFSLKANASLAIAATMRAAGVGLDVSSLGEARVALAAGCPLSRISATGFGFSEDEITELARLGIPFIADSIAQIACYGAVRPAVRTIGLRMNPGVGYDPRGLCVGGGAESPFGIGLDALDVAVRKADEAGLRVNQLHFHVGSGNSDPELYLAALDNVIETCVGRISPGVINIGGGFAWPVFPWAQPMDIGLLGKRASARIDALARQLGHPVELRVEPGEFLVGPAVSLLTKVLSIKQVTDGRPGQPGARCFVGVDTSTAHVPALMNYGGCGQVRCVEKEDCTDPTRLYRIVGNLNQSADVLAKDRELPPLEVGDLLIIEKVGAYAMTRASWFNGRGRPAEVLVDGCRVALVREREEPDELLRGQLLPPWL